MGPVDRSSHTHAICEDAARRYTKLKRSFSILTTQSRYVMWSHINSKTKAATYHGGHGANVNVTNLASLLDELIPKGGKSL